MEARIPPLASHRLRGLQPFRAERKARKHEAELRVLALVLEAWSLDSMAKGMVFIGHLGSIDLGL
jgi:hypothetical protein